MSLLENAMTACVFLTKTRRPDGEGGFIVDWAEGAEFNAAFDFNSSIQAKIAEKQGVSSLYKVTTAKGVNIDYHEVFKRLSDGKIFRATSDWDDMVTPISASFQYEQVDAEEYKI